jgi:cell division protein FtsI (penicillin-binding protein 3)
MFQASFIPWRFYFVIIFISLIALGLIVRLVDLSIVKQSFLEEEGNARTLRMITEPVVRGMIVDRHGYPLAISTSVYSVWIDPKNFFIEPIQLKNLSKLLELSSNTILALSHNTHRNFVYLKRNLSPSIAGKIKFLNIAGVHLEENYKRYYPEGEMMAQVIGMTNVDDHGQEGLELAYESWLTGTAGKKQVIKDRLGRVISDVKQLQPKKSGNNLVLSINRRIQYVAYRELMAGIKENDAESGSVVVLDAKTGEILAIVNQPSFNPNKSPKSNNGEFRNRAVTDMFEPGSTIKAFSIAAALTSGKFSSDSKIDTFPGWMRVGHRVVRDEHNNKILTLAQILQLSSNVGVTKVILSLSPDQLWKFLHNVGFGESTGVNFPGESSGRLIQRTHWDPFRLATLSFGYGLSVTPLQLARAYSVIANDGIKMPLTLLKIKTKPTGERVMEPRIAKEMLALLETVVTQKGGTGRLARIPGYRVAGKTGTAWIAANGSYLKHRYVASFVGIAPISQPRLVVAVVIRDPKGKKFLASDVSAPVFKNIMEDVLRILNIPMDSLN